MPESWLPNSPYLLHLDSRSWSLSAYWFKRGALCAAKLAQTLIFMCIQSLENQSLGPARATAELHSVPMKFRAVMKAHLLRVESIRSQILPLKHPSQLPILLFPLSWFAFSLISLSRLSCWSEADWTTGSSILPGKLRTHKGQKVLPGKRQSNFWQKLPSLNAMLWSSWAITRKAKGLWRIWAILGC